MTVAQLIQLLQDYCGTRDPETVHVVIEWWTGDLEEISCLHHDDGDIHIEARV